VTTPAFLNVRSGTAGRVAAALAAAGAQLDVHAVQPAKLTDEIRAAVAGGAPRICVIGGDGTIETAAAVLAGTATELAIIPGGTLNHFARACGIPLDVSEAAKVAVSGTTRTVDLGVVNDRIFINTSSVGAYVRFVRTRERFERYVGYRFASLLAGVRILPSIRPFEVTIQVPGQEIVGATPLVFVGVGERTLRPPDIGGRVTGGTRALHVMIVHAKARRWARAYDRSVRGRTYRWDDWSPTFVDGHLADGCRIALPRARGPVAVDGEISTMGTPLVYRLQRDALRVVSGATGG